MLKSIGIVLLSLAVAVIVIFFFEYLSHSIYHPPSNLDSTDPEQLKSWIQSLPWQALFLILFAWFCGALAGGYMIAILDPENKLRSGITLFIVLFISTLINLASIEHPVWMWPAGLLSIALGVWAGGKFVQHYHYS